MSKLLENAVFSIQLGIEDSRCNDPRRSISAVRNFYAGILLLAKEALVRAAPHADPMEIIGAKYKPVPDGKGGIEYQLDGAHTIDFHTIEKRFRDFGLSIDHKSLKDINGIRNDMEHLYSEKSDQAVREAISKAFPVVVQLFDHVGEPPKGMLGNAWDVMLETKALYDAELKACRSTLKTVEWLSGTVRESPIRCPECESHLVRQTDVSNVDQADVDFECRACGAQPAMAVVIVHLIDEALSSVAYLRAKEEGTDGPLYLCTDCNNEAYVDFEGACAVCGFEHGSAGCSMCGDQLSINDHIYNERPGLCGSCAYRLDKMMDE